MPRIMLTADEEKQNLKESVALANDYAGHELAWNLAADEKQHKRYGPNEANQFRRLLLALQEWRKTGSRDVWRMKLEPRDRKALEKYTLGIRMAVEWNGTFSMVDPTGRDWNEALRQFIRLLWNSRLAFLDGPCLNRKKHENRDFWFVKAKRRPRTFCSRHCAGDATKAKERERKRKRKIEKAQQAIRNYPQRPTRYEKLSWREYVTKAEPSLSKRFLTMVVQAGYVSPP
jgi:hypothetical protein